MAKAFCILVLLALAACTGAPRVPATDCSAPTSYECQVDMYMRAGA